MTDPRLMAEWLMENDFEPILGRKFDFRTKPMPQWNGILDCEVLALEAQRRLSYTWNSSGVEAETGLKTVVTWILTPTPAGTHLRMEQAGFRPDQQANYRGAEYGWRKFFDNLEGVLARTR